MAQYTVAQYTAITAAYAQGVTHVEYGDKRIIYRSLNEMKQIIEEMQIDLGLKKVTRKKYAQFTKGLQ
ncbi:phage head-tail joining protein [Foetidibacter luteolus]|uniref:phage head-tail joining protein n=1 Tax=Foetidibacter luteolus TaxID=2608880 RepID=UPI00129A46A3|nr:hypothetical protein [Foetidibacter luteolus]